MTITIDWWMLPLFITLSSFVYARFDYHTDNSYTGGLAGLIVASNGVSMSAGIIAGHFL